MSHTRVKTTYQVEAEFGNTATQTLYCDHNHGTQSVIFYNEHGRFEEMVFSNINCGNSLWDAMQRLMEPYVASGAGELREGVEYYNEEELTPKHLDLK